MGGGGVTEEGGNPTPLRQEVSIPPICVFAGINCNGSLEIYPFHLGCPAVLNFQTLLSDFYELRSQTGANLSLTVSFHCQSSGPHS